MIAGEDTPYSYINFHNTAYFRTLLKEADKQKAVFFCRFTLNAIEEKVFIKGHNYPIQLNNKITNCDYL